MGEVRTISRKDSAEARKRGGENPQRLYARDECSKQFTPRAGTSTFVRAKSLFGIGPVQSALSRSSPILPAMGADPRSGSDYESRSDSLPKVAKFLVG